MTDRTKTAGWKRLRRRVLDRDGWRCRKCGRAGRMEVDHVVPVKAGGTDDLDNLRAICRDCHIARHKRKRTEVEKEWDAHLAGFGS